LSAKVYTDVLPSATLSGNGGINPTDAAGLIAFTAIFGETPLSRAGIDAGRYYIKNKP